MADEENIKTARSRRERKPPKKITQKYLYNSGLAYLQRFTSSIPHFKQVMGRKITLSCKHHTEQSMEECSKFLDEVIQTFERQGLLNDDAYLSGMVTSYRRRGLSTQIIASKLQQKGLLQEKIMNALRSHDNDQGLKNPDLTAALMMVRRKRFGPYRRMGEPNMNKELSAMARAGFSFDVAKKALGMSEEDAAEFLP